MVGWVTQLIFGVAYWMFPKASRVAPRGSDGLAWITFAQLNAGLVMRAIAEPELLKGPAAGWGALLAISALLQWGAGMTFIVNIWPQIRGR
jgi:hypothetical protein